MMGEHSWTRAVVAVLLLVSMAGVVMPCADAAPGGALSVAPDGASASHGDAAAECHCVCHAGWVPAGAGPELLWNLASRVPSLAPSTPEGCTLPLPSEPPRSV